MFAYGETDAAIELANKAIERMPHCVGAHVTRGLSLVILRREAEGLGALQRAVELGPFSVRANQALALAYDAADRPLEAEVWYRAAKPFTPADLLPCSGAFTPSAGKDRLKPSITSGNIRTGPLRRWRSGYKEPLRRRSGDRKSACGY